MKIIAVLEEKGYNKDEKHERNEIKEYIMNLLSKSKKGIDPSTEEFITVRCNIEKGDHHDMIRVDQVLTRMQNKLETEYQWGSIILGLKMKI